MTPHTESTPTAADQAPGAGPRESIAWLLRQFVADVPGITHTVLLSRDGMRLLDSDVDKDWADELAAGIAGVDSLAKNITGPTFAKRPARQVVIERADCLIFVQTAGRSKAFPGNPGNLRGVVDTVLAVVATPTADAAAIGFEMGRLVDRFAPYMDIPVRVPAGDEPR
ncbi:MULTISPECIES: roadblock/LC7 domain-containing protein [unclassified Streptomyces]|uniref:roadblock/LC7 domain-containing protein n=1 Tax=unclassified Streptomyces TaxID=2593676 RepID=UPI001BAEA825|nr:roadblock/LC7 domain-containing protein [Streptomyces sp. V17-9]QUW89882.1 Serine protease inhibitor [Streptomyces sp. V17-9]